MDKTQKLLNEMAHLANDCSNSADDALRSLQDAEYEFNRLSCQDDFLTSETDEGFYLRQDMTAGVNAAVDAHREAVTKLAEFDAELAKLIHKRAQLAEVISIPMYSHLTGGLWARSEEHYL